MPHQITTHSRHRAKRDVPAKKEHQQKHPYGRRRGEWVNQDHPAQEGIDAFAAPEARPDWENMPLYCHGGCPIPHPSLLRKPPGYPYRKGRFANIYHLHPEAWSEAQRPVDIRAADLPDIYPIQTGYPQPRQKRPQKIGSYQDSGYFHPLPI